jgi:hypothetical protein
VLGRLNTSGAWQEVCGDLADTGLAIREVSCSDGDLSFGIFGVIPRPGAPIDDSTAPVFPQNSFSLTSPSRCDTCAPPSIELEWGPASDGGGSGVIGYWIYVDGVRQVFTSDTAANPTVRFTFRSSGTVDTTLRHRYQFRPSTTPATRRPCSARWRLNPRGVALADRRSLRYKKRALVPCVARRPVPLTNDREYGDPIPRDSRFQNSARAAPPTASRSRMGVRHRRVHDDRRIARVRRLRRRAPRAYAQAGDRGVCRFRAHVA